MSALTIPPELKLLLPELTKAADGCLWASSPRSRKLISALTRVISTDNEEDALTDLLGVLLDRHYLDEENNG